MTTRARDLALDFIVGDGVTSLGQEGGYANNPADKGGETFRGISRRFHGDWPGWARVDQLKTHPEFPAAAVYDGTLDIMVREFFVVEFWDKVHGDELPEKMAVAVCDFAVNSGPDTAIRFLQITLGVPVDPSSVPIEYRVGPKTVKAANDAGEDSVVSYLARRAKFLHEVMDADPTQQVWALNWLRRLFSLSNVVLDGAGVNFS